MHRADYFSGIFLIVLSLFVMVESYRMPIFKIHGGIWAAPGLVPFFIGFILFFMAVGLIVSSRNKGGKGGSITKERVLHFFKNEEFRRIIIVFGITALYIFILIRFTHYFVSTCIYLSIFMFLFGYRKWAKMAVIIVGAITAVYLLFNKIFLIPLP